MEMNKPRTLIRERRLEKFSRILSDRYNIELKLSPGRKLKGCCDNSYRVWISATIDDDPVKNLVLQKGVTLHEIGHLLFTKSSAWSKPLNNREITKALSNIIADGRCEEAMSRLYKKARIYFIYTNREILTYNRNKDIPVDYEKLTYEFILREAKRRTGAPQLPKDDIKLLKEYLKDNYDIIKQLTRNAVDAKTEDKAAKFAIKLQSKMNEIFQEQQHMYDNISNTLEKSIEKTGSTARQMPQEVDDEVSEILDDAQEELENSVDEEISKDNSDDETDETDDETDDDVNVSFDVKSDDEETDLPQGNIDDLDIKPDSVPSDDSDDDIDVDDSVVKSDSGTPIPSDSEDSDDIDSKLDELTSKIESLMNQVEDSVTEDATSELQNENDVLKSGQADAEFPDYGIEEDEEFNPRTKYGSFKLPVDVHKLEPTSRKISRQLRIIASRGDGWVTQQTRGKLDMNRITSVANKKSTKQRIFRQKQKIDGVDLAVSILIDASGSMGDYRSQIATEVSYTLARALEINKYKSEVVQFGMKHSGYRRTSNSFHSDCRGVKSFQQTTQYARKRFLPASQGLTPMFGALDGADKSIYKQNASRKVVFVVTDGYPQGSISKDELMELAKEHNINIEEDDKYNHIYLKLVKKKVSDMERRGIIVIGALINVTDRKKIFKHSFSVYKTEEIETKMVEALKGVLRTINH